MVDIVMNIIPKIDRFNGKFVRKGDDECWVWTGSKNPDGYGCFYWERNKKTIGTHRAAWLLNFGEIPSGMHVLHTCDNPPCVNPGHLFLGTHGDNMKDKSGKKRVKSGPQFGENNPRSKLGEKDILDIRSSSLSNLEMSKKYGVSDSLISAICRGRAWKHVPGKRDRKPPTRIVGEDSVNSKLTENDVIYIGTSGERNCDLARKYGILPSSVNNIRKRRCWKHI